MKLARDILINVLKDTDVKITFTNLDINAKEIVELTCYQALKEIRKIINDPTLDDASCFSRIEEIVCLLEDIGSNGGSRHDF